MSCSKGVCGISLAVAGALLLSCDAAPHDESAQPAVQAEQAVDAAVRAATGATDPSAGSGGADAPDRADAAERRDPRDAYEAAKSSIAEVLESPTLAGAENFEAKRAELLARAKGYPVFFIQTPRPVSASDEVRHYRYRITSTDYPWDVLEQLLPHFERNPREGRDALLRDGYLYAEDPKLAYALVSLVKPEHLFEEPRIWIQRGSRLMHAERKQDGYVYTDGLYAQQPVRLIHLDRMGVGEAPDTPALHRDFLSLRYELGFERVRVKHIRPDRLVAELRYGPETWVPTLLRSEGPRLSLMAEAIEPKLFDEVQELRVRAEQRVSGLRALYGSILQQVDEQLPFDEPVTEVDQEDGTLRRSWAWVYSQGRKSYHVRYDRYRVFDPEGRPMVPQVCIDFLIDSMERASGTWWRAEGEAPGRELGTIDFGQWVPRNELRRTRRFVEFARERPDWFDVLEVPVSERVHMGVKREFYSYLAEHADDYIPADMVLIRGKTPWDPREEHSHAFFVYETDPVTGVPIAVVGNARIPTVWSWEAEVRRTPQRTIRHRIRPTLALLQVMAKAETPDAPMPPPLAPNDEYNSPVLLQRRASQP